jgi:hypothetical protein
MNPKIFTNEGAIYDKYTGADYIEDIMSSNFQLNDQELSPDLNQDLHPILNQEMTQDNNNDYSGFLDSQFYNSSIFGTEDKNYMTHMGNGGMNNFNCHNIPNHNNLIDNNNIQNINNNNCVFGGELEKISYGMQNLKFSVLERRSNSDIILNKKRVRFVTSVPEQSNDHEYNEILASNKKSFEPYSLKKRIFPKFVSFLFSYFGKLIFHNNRNNNKYLNQLAVVSPPVKENIKIEHLEKYRDNPISCYFCQHHKENLNLISYIKDNQKEYVELYSNFKKTMQEWLDEYILSPEFNSDSNKAVQQFSSYEKIKNLSPHMKVKIEKMFRKAYVSRASNILKE